MRAIVCEELGPPDSLKLLDLPSPEPGPGQVRVKVEAAGANFPDTLIIEGKYQIKPELPFSPGSEVAGTVDALGEGVTRFKIGEPVISLTGYGGFAEEILVDAERVHERPASMDPITGAGVCMTYGTSMHGLKQRANLQPGETLLVLGAAGGVGLAAVEIGKAMGAKVIAAASTAEKLEVAKKAGADEVINYTEGSLKDRLKEMTGGKGVDVVYDPVGGNLFEDALRATAWEGRVLVIGFASGTIPKAPVNLALLKGCSIVGVFYGAFRMRDPEADRENFRQLFAWHAEGKLKPLVSQVLPLEEAPQALKTLGDRGAVGKIVLKTRNHQG